MNPETRQVFSWLLATALPETVAQDTLFTAVAQFKELIGTRPKRGWLIDASGVKKYDVSLIQQIQDALGHLAMYGLFYVAIVHPNEMVRAVIAEIKAPVVKIRTFETRRDAEGWFQRSCRDR